MKYYVSWQDIFCRFNIWHRYTDWQYDTRSVQGKKGETILIQSRFCFNCHWRNMKEFPFSALKTITRLK